MITNELAADLLRIQAIQIETRPVFTWASGIQSPVYCDNRLTMSYPAVRNKIRQAFLEHISESGLQPDIIAGCATAGIPHAAWLADALDLPMVYVRSSPKGHGKGNQIEGALKTGQKVILIEDLISTGMSSIHAANILMEHGAHVLEVDAIFSYGLAGASEKFAEADLPFYVLTTFDTILHHLSANCDLEASDRRSLLSWRDQL